MNFELPGIVWVVILLLGLVFLVSYLPNVPPYLLALAEAAAAALIRIIEVLVRRETGEAETMRGRDRANPLTRILFGG